MTSNGEAPMQSERDLAAESSEQLDLKDPGVVLSLLEADQVVAAKRQSRFGPRNLSLGVRILLWGLRIYVVVMLILVLVSVYRAVSAPY
ncbi:MAG TPA: hypothetical protein VHX49_01200 [Candidatus Acidoferrales bacterium]|nr:hypothetical protein [Candidatus Acidoferrales bacterium]